MDEVEREVKAEQERTAKAEEAHNEAQKTLGAFEKQREQFDQLEQQKDEAAREHHLYERLAQAFGKNGIQALIIQNAQDRLRVHANTTLGKLSGGVLQIRLAGDDDSLEIFVQDMNEPDHRRPFEYISGGERFRVAVSLAVGIGQSLAGGRTVQSLFIDEGFGALDEENRGLMVDELHRLSQDVLEGGRVVVVSHQEDVQERFPHSYRIRKDEIGATVEMNS